MSTTVYARSEGQRFKDDHHLCVVFCPSCFVRFAIPDSFDDAARAFPGGKANGGWSITCPFGHSWHYTGESTEAKLKRQLKAERDYSARKAAEADQAKADARAQKAAKTRIKNSRDRERRRVAHGVCPCCTRSFKDLRRHMAAKHPEHAIPEPS